MAVVSPRVQIESTETNPILNTQRQVESNRQGQTRKRRIANRYTKCFFIGQWPVLYIIAMTIIANYFIHFPTEATNNPHTGITYKVTVISRATRGLVLLLFPFMGWLAEAYLTYYKAIGIGLYLILVSMLIAFVLAITGLYSPKDDIYNWIGAGIALVMMFLGNGIFTANAIQLGTDQMLEASSDQLSSFVHWYYWASQLGGPVSYLTIILIGSVTDWDSRILNIYFMIVVLTLSQIVLAIVGITMFHAAKHHLYIQPTRRNTISTIYSILLYAKKHKYPERRSALTYWEDFNPGRIDLGKEKYGGPFTAEEVENTKSFLRILLLLITLFGLYTVDNTITLTETIVQNYTNHTLQTVSQPIQLFIVHNTEFVSHLLVLVTIPLYQILVKPFLNNYTLSMLKRFWLGLFCALLSSISALMIKIFVDTETSSNDICTNSSIPMINIIDINVILALLTIPQLLYGFAKLLVFLTGLEFILAQAPRSVQGLLIGLWYALGIIQQANDSIDDAKIGKICQVYITRCCITAVSIIAYSIAVYFYKYRSRGDIVDRYGLAANKIERAIRTREQVRDTRKSHDDNIYMHISVSTRNSINSTETNEGSNERTLLL